MGLPWRPGGQGRIPGGEAEPTLGEGPGGLDQRSALGGQPNHLGAREGTLPLQRNEALKAHLEVPSVSYRSSFEMHTCITQGTRVLTHLHIGDKGRTGSAGLWLGVDIVQDRWVQTLACHCSGAVRTGCRWQGELVGDSPGLALWPRESPGAQRLQQTGLALGSAEVAGLGHPEQGGGEARVSSPASWPWLDALSSAGQ